MERHRFADITKSFQRSAVDARRSLNGWIWIYRVL